MLNLVLEFSNGLNCSPIIRNNMKKDCPGDKKKKKNKFPDDFLGLGSVEGLGAKCGQN